LIELPIAEMIDSISIYSKTNVDTISIQSGLSVLSDFSSQLADTQNENKELKRQLEFKNYEWNKYKKARLIAYISLLGLVTCFYLLVILIMFIVTNNIQNQISFTSFIFDKTEIHLAFIGILLAVAIPTFPKELLGKSKDKKLKMEEKNEEKNNL